VKLWDLRKLQNFQTIQEKDITSLSNVRFDGSGSYLALCGEDIRMYAAKGWVEVAGFRQHKAAVTDLMFGIDGNFFASVSKDRTLKFWSE